MKYVFQFARILAFCVLGEALHALLPLPVPASIYGLVLFLMALRLHIVTPRPGEFPLDDHLPGAVHPGHGGHRGAS